MMTSLRLFGILFGLVALALVWAARFRWHRLRNLEWLLGTVVAATTVALGLYPDAANAVLGFFSFEKGGGQRILGLLIFFVAAQYLLTFLALARNRRLENELDRLVRQLAKQDYRRKHGTHDASIYVVIPAYNEADNIEPVLARIPKEVLGMRVRPLVVVDGATDATQQVVERMKRPGSTKPRLVIMAALPDVASLAPLRQRAAKYATHKAAVNGTLARTSPARNRPRPRLAQIP